MPSQFTENSIRLNEKQSVFVITNGLNIIFYAYPTPKEKTVVLTHWHE